MSDPKPTAKAECEWCEQLHLAAGEPWMVEDHLKGLHAEIAALRERVERAEALNEYWVGVAIRGTGLTRERIEAEARRALKEAEP